MTSNKYDVMSVDASNQPEDNLNKSEIQVEVHHPPQQLDQKDKKKITNTKPSSSRPSLIKPPGNSRSPRWNLDNSDWVEFRDLSEIEITDSLVKFGLSDSDTDILAVVIDPDVEHKVEKLNGQIRGKLVSLEEMSSLTKVLNIMEMYKIPEEELTVSSLLDAVISRMACKDFYPK
ncbi:uncharacterized protein [Palaemon carinicauda]|uniref:uncharacterized protein n=1 Tax=Palaemon carinicauda TaxID=392227 RepID=UPI0035B66F6D